jgi:pullulanase
MDRGEISFVHGTEEWSSNLNPVYEDMIDPAFDLKNSAQAYWLSRDTIVWPVEINQEIEFFLYFDFNCGLRITPEGLQGGSDIPLNITGQILTNDLELRFPHLSNRRMLKIPGEFLGMVPDILKGQYVIAAKDMRGSILGISGLQIPGVLDDLYACNQYLGVGWETGTPALHLWAPTARSVDLIIFDQPSSPVNWETEGELDLDSQGISIPMNWDPTTGIWWVIGKPDWKDKYYLYAIELFVRQEGKVIVNQVTDPYSLSLSENSTRSQIINLSDPALCPTGWQNFEKPELRNFTDIAIYELHVRDFSVRDEGVPKKHRGTFLAFTHPKSNGMRHLRWLAKMGITHIHLLPVFDFATVNENKSEWKLIDWNTLSSLPPDSEEQQSILNHLRGQDGYNWGYDPFHFTVPEGSYSIQPDSSHRVLEFRKMVKALNQIGLRVVMDVVYNHTHASGQCEKSVLDRIVPGYYHRLDREGLVIESTCCQNTATEHAMMRKLMIDSVLTWARAYKIDGFRFDLMGHHLKSDIEALREELDALTIERDGIDGRNIYIYGEGWDFGEVTNNTRGINATQINMAGTGIGTFNDRIRDAVRGGRPFNNLQEQGFSTGLYTDPNEVTELSKADQLSRLLKLKDQIRVSLAGNLADYEFKNFRGELISGAEINYNGHPAGYNHIPHEHIPYVSAHDNETLFDAIQYKAPSSTSLEDRVRIQNFALSIVALSQGVPFFHAGCEILRSKSMDRDSYESTDWYNAIDWTFKDNNWGHGLPPEDINRVMWPVIQPLLGDPNIAPGQDDILMSRDMFGKLLQIRRSSPLFQLQTARQIKELLRFHNTGKDQIPGLIVMSIRDDPFTWLDQNFWVIFVLFNADPQNISFHLSGWEMDNLSVHPVQTGDPYLSSAQFDKRDQIFSIPGRSTVVFVGSR